MYFISTPPQKTHTHTKTQVALKRGYMQVAVLVFPLIFLVEYFRSYTKSAYVRQTTVLSREVAVEIDRRFQPPQPPPSPGDGIRESSSLLNKNTGMKGAEEGVGGVEGEGEEGEDHHHPSLTMSEIRPSGSERFVSATSFINKEAIEVTARVPPYESFDKHLYRQPALHTGALRPLPPKMSKRAIRRKKKANKLLNKGKGQEKTSRRSGGVDQRASMPASDSDYDSYSDGEEEENMMNEVDNLEDEANYEDEHGTVSALISGTNILESPLIDSEHSPSPNYKSTEARLPQEYP
jgi:hypothetical protein